MTKEEIHDNLNYFLMEKLREGNIKEVKKLLQHGADIHAHDCLGIRLAFKHGHLACIKAVEEITGESIIETITS